MIKEQVSEVYMLYKLKRDSSFRSAPFRMTGKKGGTSLYDRAS